MRKGCGVLFFKQWFEDLPDIFGDDAVAGGGGMDTVLLIEAGYAADVLEEEGDQDGVVIGGEFREDIFECVGVGGAHVGRDLHAGDDDGCGGITGLH